MCMGSAAKVSDFIRTVRILKVSFYAYFTRILIFRTVSLYEVSYDMNFRIFYCRRLRIFQKEVGSTDGAYSSMLDLRFSMRAH